MEVIGIIAEYNPFHNGHLYHIHKIKEMYPNSLIILVLNGYFLQRGDISFLTKEEKTIIALQYQIDLVVQLPVIYGTQSADVFANMAIKLLNYLQVTKIIFGSESNDLNMLSSIAQKQSNSSYQKQIKENLKKGVNYPTALAKSLHVTFDFNQPNDLLAISYIKTILNNHYPMTPITIKRTSSYHDISSNNTIISATNIRHKFLKEEDISFYLPKHIITNLKKPNEKLFFQLLKVKILTTPHLEQFLTVDEGIENRLKEKIITCTTLDQFVQEIKTKRYTYNKIHRMFIHILLGITKEVNTIATLDYLHILGFNTKGQKYLQKIKKELNIPIKPIKSSYIYQYELIASSLYDILQNTNTYDSEIKHKPIIYTK